MLQAGQGPGFALVIDDDEGVRSLFTRTLQDDGWEVAQTVFSRLPEALPRGKFSEVVVMLLGDIVDGDLAFPDQPWELEKDSYPLLQVARGVEITARFLEELSSRYGRVRVEGVPGNHGDTRRGSSKANVYDNFFLEQLSIRLRDKVPVRYEPKKYLLVASVGQVGFLMYHGRFIYSYHNVPWYGISQRVLRWSQSVPGWDVLVLGHFHSFGVMEVAGKMAFLNGTLLLDDDYCLEKYGYRSSGRWWCLEVGEKIEEAHWVDLERLL